MSILFINGSPNKNGNTAALAETLMNGKEYQTLHLTDYKLYGYGQDFEDDQFAEIVAKMKSADTIVIGSPVYWHNMCGLVRNLIDRFYGPISEGELGGQKICFSVSGSSTGKMDVGKSGIYHESLCSNVRYGVYRYGNKPCRSKAISQKHINSFVEWEAVRK